MNHRSPTWVERAHVRSRDRVLERALLALKQAEPVARRDGYEGLADVLEDAAWNLNGFFEARRRLKRIKAAQKAAA